MKKIIDVGHLICPDSLLPDLRLKHILLDTSFFIDAAEDNEVFFDFRDKCKKNGITLVSIHPVTIEYVKGSASEQERKKRISFIESFTEGYYLPIPPNIYSEHIPNLLKKYGQLAYKASLTDLILGVSTITHTRDLVFLTKNTSDFPLSVFDLESYILFQNKKTRSLQVYGLYSCKVIEEADEPLF